MSTKLAYTIGGNLATISNSAIFNEFDYCYRFYDPDTHYSKLIKSNNGEYGYPFSPNFAYDTSGKYVQVVNDNATAAGMMFQDSFNLKSLPDNCFNNVINAWDMFYRCSGLDCVPANSFSSVTAADNMFEGCYALTSINSEFNSVIIASEMFSKCSGLQHIPTAGFTNVQNVDMMFNDCMNMSGSIIDFISAHSATVTAHNGTFAYCTAMSDYDVALAQYPDWF